MEREDSLAEYHFLWESFWRAIRILPTVLAFLMQKPYLLNELSWHALSIKYVQNHRSNDRDKRILGVNEHQDFGPLVFMALLQFQLQCDDLIEESHTWVESCMFFSIRGFASSFRAM